MKEKNAGITLIALTITIIIMLIVISVSIQIAMQSGLFKSAGKAANNWQTAQNAEEKIGDGKITIDGQEYNSIDEYVETVNGGNKIIDWNAILADATANPEKYKHAEQSSANGDIGIGTDGKPVNLDLWTYEVINGNEMRLGRGEGSAGNPGYQNSNIVDGKIIGKVPQYIKVNGTEDFYQVTSMDLAFQYCTSLVTAPAIPSSVTSMFRTFYNCRSLTTAPEIPSGVTSMNYTFMNCAKLQGTIEINANPTSYSSCFSGAATEGTGLVVTGSSTMLDTLIGTKSGTSNITNGT